MTAAGVEPATFRFVTKHLSHCLTAVPRMCMGTDGILNSYGGELKVYGITGCDTLKFDMHHHIGGTYTLNQHGVTSQKTITSTYAGTSFYK